MKGEELLQAQEELAQREIELQESKNETKNDLNEEFAKVSAETFGGMTEATAEFFTQSEKDSKEYQKQLLEIALTALESTVILSLAKAKLISLSQTDSIATFGVAELVHSAVLTALIKGVFEGIKSQLNSFHEGGETGPGVFRDETGRRVAGIVHENEYLVPEVLRKDPKAQPALNYLESLRTGKYNLSGYYGGGLVRSNTTPERVGRNVFHTDTGKDSETLIAINRSIEMLRRDVQNQRETLRAMVVLDELEESQAVRDQIRRDATV